MSKTAYQKTALTGGAATALDGINGSGLADGDFAYVFVSDQVYHYILDSDSAAAESSPNIIAPDTNPGDKRWILQGAVFAGNVDMGTTRRVSTIADLIAANAAAAGTVDHIIVTEDVTLTANLTITKALTIEQGGLITKASTYTLTINGAFEAGPYQVFSGFSAGDVTGLDEAKAVWWQDNTTPGTTDMSTAIQCALSSGAAKIILQPEVHAIATTLTMTTEFNWTLESSSAGYTKTTTLKWTGAADGTMMICYGCRWFHINNIQFDGNSLAGVGLQVRNSLAGDVVSDFYAQNLYIRDVSGSPGIGLYLGEGDASPGISNMSLYDFQSFSCTEGVRINNGAGQNIRFFGGYITGGTYGINCEYGGWLETYNLCMGANTYHFRMGTSSRTLNMFGGYFEGNSLIDWVNHNGVSINMIGITHTYTGASDVITYRGGNLAIVSQNNYFGKGVTLASAGNQAVSVVSIEDTFVSGTWTNSSNSKCLVVKDAAITSQTTITAPTITGSTSLVSKDHFGNTTTAINNSSATDIALGTSFFAVVRDGTNGGGVLVVYESGRTPVLLGATGGATTFTTSAPDATEIQIANRAANGGITALGGSSRAAVDIKVVVLRAQ